MNLKSQKALAAKILKVGINRVWIDPSAIDDVSAAITREDIRALIKDGAIKALKIKDTSRVRARKIQLQKLKGRRRGHGSRKGGKKARMPKKLSWMKKIRAQRELLRKYKLNKKITVSTYRKLYMMAKGGYFKDRKTLETYIIENNLLRR